MTVYLLIIIALGIIGLIGKLIKKENFRLKNESAFHSLYLFGYIAFFLFIINLNMKYDYSMGSAEYDRIDLRIPYLSDELKLSHRSKNSESWLNINSREMQVGHYKKEITLDYSGIEKEIDVFINI